ncbi:hypothetical protein AB4144_66195, partial [Rhizobiaceae sp. 2RAB30]
DQGKQVVLTELDARLGGSANWSEETIGGIPAADWAEAVASDLAGRDSVRLLPRTTAWGYYDDNTIAALERVTDHKATPDTGE